MISSPKCVGALLVRNEAAPDRYLQRALDNALQFVDEIVVVDDGSTDDTAAMCRKAGAIVHERPETVNKVGWWGDTTEHTARSYLWTEAAAAAEPTGWVYVFDADHELLGITPPEFRRLLTATVVDAWACVLWDCWQSDALHRVDGFWQAWRSPRPWLARANVPWGSQSGLRGIHTGHLPPRHNWTVGLMPQGAGIRHLGYIQEQHRVAKRDKYLKLSVAQPKAEATCPTCLPTSRQPTHDLLATPT